MLPANLIVTERIRCGVAAPSKKRVLEQLGKLLASTSSGLTQDHVFDRLLERERLGSTGLGHGIALPHARMAEIDQAYGAFVQLTEPVDFDAIDGEPVDLAFALLVPEEATQEHLQLLASLAALFNEESFCAKLRQADSPELILGYLTSEPTPEASA